ncbi:MAG: ComEC/Rec2 family competence protein [Rikenellaceae bacterium]|nr:ComEC/Rec2 family competence protein [Rikenellaceae bacterium]
MSAGFTQLISKIPMAVVIVPFVMGIFFAEKVLLPIWLLFLACVVSLVGVVSLSKWWQNCAIVVMIFSVGALLHSLSYRSNIIYDTPVEMLIAVETTSVERKGYTSAEAKISESADLSLVGSKVVVWGDSLTKFKAGDRLLLTTPIRPFRADRKQYAQLMQHRGFIGSISINQNTIYEYSPTERRTLHDRAVSRLQGAMAEGDARAVVLAMTTGERSEISSELRQNYSASGASHLLAVSGLHIGIAFMLINILLLPMVLLRYGNIARSILAVALIWLYVWLCGMSPSAVRAAIMFSFLQFSLSSLREYTSVNILAGTAFVMLAFNSHLLFDISFQLSFIAVAGIILWAMPLYRVCATRFKFLNSIIGIMLVGIASTLATMPLVANTFSTVSLVGILINPAVILLANIVVLAGVVAIALPFTAIIAEYAALWQNQIVEWAASLPYGHFIMTIPEWAMWLIYGVFLVVTLLLWQLPKQEKTPKIEG